MSTTRFEPTPIKGTLLQVFTSVVDRPAATGTASHATTRVLMRFAETFWQKHQVVEARVYGGFEAWLPTAGTFAVAAKTSDGKQLLVPGKYYPKSGAITFGELTQVPDAHAAAAAYERRALVATANGKLLGNNGDNPIYLFKMPAGTDAARVAEEARRNARREVVFTTQEGSVYVIQSRHLGGLPAVGDALEVQDVARQAVLRGTVTGVDAERTYLSTVGLVGSGMATLLGGLGLFAMGVAPIVEAFTFGTLTASTAGASSLAALFAGGAAALTGFAVHNYRRAQRDHLAEQAEEAVALQPYSWEWSAAKLKDTTPGVVRRTARRVAGWFGAGG